MRASRLTRTAPQERNQYARTALDFLVNDPDGFPSDYPPGAWTTPPPPWWLGLDSGGGAYPIGPNGPYASTVSAVPAVVRATALITGPITSAPFRVTVGDAPRPAPRWLVDPMLVQPDARFPGPEQPEVMQLPRALFWTEFVRSAIWWGLGAFVCTEDAEGQPLAGSLRMVDSRQLSTVRDPDSDEWLWVLGTDGDSATFDRSGRITFAHSITGGPLTYRLVVLRNPHSPVDAAGNSLGVFALSPRVYSLATQIDSYASGTFRSGIPAGYLKVQTPGLTKEAAGDLRERWLASHGGDRRSIAVLNATTDFQPLNLSPVDAALDSVKRLNLADVAFSFGLDPTTLGAGLANSATYNNVRDSWANHRDFGLAPYTSAVEDCLSALLPGTGSVRVNLDGFANPTPAERFAAYEVAIRAGVLTVDEVRALEHLPPVAPPPEPEPPTPVPAPAPEEVAPNDE